MKKVLWLAALSISGCAAFQNLSVDDVSTPEYLRRTVVLDMTIPQIQQALYDYSAKCTQLPPLRINPAKPNSAIYMTTAMGLTQLNPGVLIKFEQSGNKTTANAYTSFSTVAWTDKVNDVFDAIQDPTKCK